MRAFDKKEWKNYDHDHFVKDIVWDTKASFLKIEEKGVVLGTMELKVEGGVGTIKTIIVKKGLQGKGIGKILIKKAEELTWQQNGHKLFLTTGKNWQAVRFYESMGFAKSADLPNHYFGVDFIEMTKFLF